LCVLASLLPFFSEKIACGKMEETIISDEIFGLGSFAAPWSTEEEEDVRFGEDSIVLLLFLRS
jgi:hypothetical protein